MARFARQHEYRIWRWLALSCALVVLGAWLFPTDWLRVFARHLEVTATGTAPAQEPWIRLIPAESLEPGLSPDIVRVRRFERLADDSPSTDSRREARRTWTFDPTTAFRPLAGTAEPLAPGVPDSIRLHAEFLHSLRLGNMAAVFALLDTTQTGRAREQLVETDDWVNRYLGPVWTAQGHARFQSDLWWRVVGESDAEGKR